MSRARYRLLSPGGEAREDGEAEVEVRDGMLVLAPVSRAWHLRVPGDLAAVNWALDGAGFDPAAADLATAGPVPHDADWAGRIAALLG